MDPVGLFMLSPQAGLRAMAAQDSTGFLQATLPIWSQYVGLNEPILADEAGDLALLTSVPALGRAAMAAAPAGVLDELALLLANANDPAIDALFEGTEHDPLAVADPVDRVMAYLSEGNVRRLPH